MNILKHKVDKDFTVAPNILFRDTRLSYKAKGLWLQMISLPENWQFSVAGMASLALDNDRAIKSAIKELVACGYLKWDKMHDDSGKFTVVVTTLLPDISPRGKTSTGQNAIWQNADNKELTNKELTNNKELNNNTHDEEKELLRIINQTLGREFRVLPRGTRKTLDTFTLQEIETALKNLAVDVWHSERLPTLKLDYLLRATTIDKFRLEEAVQVGEKVAHMKLNLETGKMEEIYE